MNRCIAKGLLFGCCLGLSMLMSLGLPYDSDKARSIAAAVTAIMAGTAYATSAELAEHLGPFKRFAENREPMLGVIKMHSDAVAQIDKHLCPAKKAREE